MLGATNTSIEIIASGIAPKPTQGLTLPSLVFVLSTRTPITSSQIAPTKPAIRNTTSTMCEREAESKPFPLNAKSAKKVVV